MSTCFGDTSYFLALLIPQDTNHAAAQAVAQTLRRRVVTTDFVVLEVGNFLSATPVRRKFVAFLRSLHNDPHVTIVPASAELLKRGVDLYLARPDKEWSLTDCISFVVMQDCGITEALTTDHDFAQAGFTVLLK